MLLNTLAFAGNNQPASITFDPLYAVQHFPWTGTTNRSTGAAFTADGQYFLTAHRQSASVLNLLVIDTANWDVVATVPLPGTGNGAGLSVSPDGRYVAIANSAGGSGSALYIVDTTTWGVVPGSPAIINTTATSVDFSSDGSMLAVTFSTATAGVFLQILDTETWESIGGPPSITAATYIARFSPDGAWLAVGASNTMLRVYNTADWSIAFQPAGNMTILGMCWSPDGSRLYVSHQASAGAFRVYNTAPWSVVHSAQTTPWAGALAVSPDGKSVCWGGASGYSLRPYLIDTADWSVRLLADRAAASVAVAFSPVPLDIPTIPVTARDPDGPISATMRVFALPDAGVESVFDVDAHGSEAEIDVPLLLPGARMLLLSSDDGRHVSRIGTASKDTQPRVRLILPSTTAVQIGGKVNVEMPTGRPGEFTSIVDADTGETYSVSGPDADGYWTANVPPGDYYLLYTEPDCQPLVEGPYHVEAP